VAIDDFHDEGPACRSKSGLRPNGTSLSFEASTLRKIMIPREAALKPDVRAKMGG